MGAVRDAIVLYGQSEVLGCDQVRDAHMWTLRPRTSTVWSTTTGSNDSFHARVG